MMMYLHSYIIQKHLLLIWKDTPNCLFPAVMINFQKEQKDILEIIIKEKDFLMESLTDMFGLLHGYEIMLKTGIDTEERD
jgi:hypothetical protein